MIARNSCVLIAATWILGAALYAQPPGPPLQAQRTPKDRFPGPDAGDFTGLPLNEDGLARALSYSTSALAMPERQCMMYPPHYTEFGPFNLPFRIFATTLNAKHPHTAEAFIEFVKPAIAQTTRVLE